MESTARSIYMRQEFDRDTRPRPLIQQHVWFRKLSYTSHTLTQSPPKMRTKSTLRVGRTLGNRIARSESILSGLPYAERKSAAPHRVEPDDVSDQNEREETL